MKRLSYLFVLLLTLFIVPFGVFAEEAAEDTKDEAVEEVSKEVPIYFFRGDGCSFCAKAEDWFKEIEDEYGSKFEIKDYETWYNQENAELMQKVAETRNETADGVPYIIIGDQSWSGFADEYKSEILNKIKEVYDVDVNSRYDIMQLVETGSTNTKKEKSTGSDVVSLIIILAVVGAAGYGIYKARETVKE